MSIFLMFKYEASRKVGFYMSLWKERQYDLFFFIVQKYFT